MNAKSLIILGVVCIPVVTVLLLWLAADYPWGTWRYRVIVEIATPEGIKTGSAIRELRVHTEPGFLGVRKQGVARLVGEAVVIDLGQRSKLFALLTEDDLFQAFPYNNGAGVLAPEGIRFYNELKSGMKAPLPPAKYPTFVIFADLNDPKSVQLAYGSRFDVETQKTVPVDQLEELLGVGVNVRSVTIEITNDPVAWNIDKVLPWLRALNGGYLDGRFSGGGPELSNILHGGKFINEGRSR